MCWGRDGDCALCARAGFVSSYEGTPRSPMLEFQFSHRNGFGPRALISPKDDRSFLSHPLTPCSPSCALRRPGFGCGGSFPANDDDAPNVGRGRDAADGDAAPPSPPRRRLSAVARRGPGSRLEPYGRTFPLPGVQSNDYILTVWCGGNHTAVCPPAAYEYSQAYVRRDGRRCSPKSKRKATKDTGVPCAAGTQTRWVWLQVTSHRSMSSRTLPSPQTSAWDDPRRQVQAVMTNIRWPGATSQVVRLQSGGGGGGG